jgi:hypothetical protein
MTDHRTVPGVDAPTADRAAEPVDAHPDTGQRRAAAAIVMVLALAGCLLGLVWAWWSPAGPAGERIPAGVIVDETEAFIAADGRFLVLTAAVGLVAALVAWRLRYTRGAWVAGALGLGGVVGALLTELIGHLVKGASPAIPEQQGVVVYRHLALSVHATGLLLAEGAVAALVYGLFVAFTAYDDLGRPDPVRAGLRPDVAASSDSVEPGWQPHDGWGHRDAAGPLQQRDLPPQ